MGKKIDSAIIEDWTDKLWVQQLLAEAKLEALECESNGQLKIYSGSGTEKKTHAKTDVMECSQDSQEERSAFQNGKR